jgi:hypothetical protein
MEQSVFSLLYRSICERKASLTDYTMSGGARDHNAYTHAVAQYEAYTAMEEEIKELEKRFMES